MQSRSTIEAFAGRNAAEHRRTDARPLAEPGSVGSLPGPAVARRRVAEKVAIDYQLASKAKKSEILNNICMETGWHRNHARKVLRSLLTPTEISSRAARSPRYGVEVLTALVLCWEVLDRPAGKRLAPMLRTLVPTLRRHGELTIDDGNAQQLMTMSPATIDRRLSEVRASRSQVPGEVFPPAIRNNASIYECNIPGTVLIRTMQIHGPLHAVVFFDLATGWTETRSFVETDPASAIRAFDEIAHTMPFPVTSVASPKVALLDLPLSVWCTKRHIAAWPEAQIEFPQNSFQAVSVMSQRIFEEEKPIKIANEMWRVRSLLENHFIPRQSLQEKSFISGKPVKKYETSTSSQRVLASSSVTGEDKTILRDVSEALNPAQLQRQAKTLAGALFQLLNPGAEAERRCPAVPIGVDVKAEERLRICADAN